MRHLALVALGAASAGSPEVIVVVQDEVSQRKAEGRAAFVVTPAAGS